MRPTQFSVTFSVTFYTTEPFEQLLYYSFRPEDILSCEGKTPRLLIFRTVCGQVVRFTPWMHFLRRNNFCYVLNKGTLDAVERNVCPLHVGKILLCSFSDLNSPKYAILSRNLRSNENPVFFFLLAARHFPHSERDDTIENKRI